MSIRLCSCLQVLVLALTPAVESDAQEAVPDLVAANAFYYYNDVDRALLFYRDVLGFETVVDYGFAKIMRVTDASYLTLVDAAFGMHSADEPKTITLSLVTDDFDAWYDYLEGRRLVLEERIEGDEGIPGRFVIADPEDYFIVFVEAAPELEMFSGLQCVATNVPADKPLTVRASILSAYFEDLASIDGFYEGLLGVEPAGDLDGSRLLHIAGGGFIGLNGGDHINESTKENGFTLSFFTNDVDAWFARASAWPGLELRTQEVLDEGGLVKVFVGYDPTGIFLEWDTFLDVEQNEILNRYLKDR